MTGPQATDEATHCPRCFAEYRAGVSVCPDDGTQLEAGPSPNFGPSFDAEPVEPARGTIEIVRLAPTGVDPDVSEGDDPGAEAGGEAGGLFEREAHPREVILAIIASEDAADFVATLEAQGVGARLGDATENEGVEVVIHDINLAEAQAILVEYTGDPSLVDDIGTDDDDDTHDSLARVATGGVGGLGAQAERLSSEGIDVRLEVPGPGGDQGDMGALWVARDDLDQARRILGIVI